MTLWQRFKTTPPMEWTDQELAGLLLAIAMQGEQQNPDHDPTVAAALREASRRLANRDSQEHQS
jgi:hypothetical protein